MQTPEDTVRRCLPARTWKMDRCADRSFGQPSDNLTVSRRCGPLEISRFAAPLDRATGIRAVVRTGTGRATVGVDRQVVPAVPAMLGPVRLGSDAKPAAGPCCFRITPAVGLPTDPDFMRGKPAKSGLPATGRSDPNNRHYRDSTSATRLGGPRVAPAAWDDSRAVCVRSDEAVNAERRPPLTDERGANA